MSGGPRPARAVRNRAIRRAREKRQQTNSTHKKPTQAEQANDYIQQYYQDLAKAREQNRAWLEEGVGNQTEIEVEATEWIKRQIKGERRSFTQAEIDAVIREARENTPRAW